MEFKMNAGSTSDEDIGKYISTLSNGATISNQPFGYLVWRVEDKTHAIKSTNFHFQNAKHGNQDLELWLRTLLQPKINFGIFDFDYQGRHIALLRIPSAKGDPTQFQKTPYFFNKGSDKTSFVFS